ncbi:hypothetical protein BDB01DRAFT_771669 [Pilobolus umbonatus]|nr:hypothetical protein BDB01DRAFT_771669 [Pilobolus umbonatus]
MGNTSTMGNTGFGASAGGNGFGQPITNNQLNPINNISTPSTTSNTTMNTSGDITDQSVIEAFAAPNFTYRAIPEVEPPLEYR